MLVDLKVLDDDDAAGIGDAIKEEKGKLKKTMDNRTNAEKIDGEKKYNEQKDQICSDDCDGWWWTWRQKAHRQMDSSRTSLGG